MHRHMQTLHAMMTELPDNFQTAPLAEVDPEIAAVLDARAATASSARWR